MSFDAVELWHKRARPEPSKNDFNIQLGCHFEEIAEMMAVLAFDFKVTQYAVELERSLNIIANMLKQGMTTCTIADREEFLDSIADQVVTGIGTAYCAGMKPSIAISEVNQSNWSKFDQDGQPIRNEQGKIAKGPNYKKPNLDGLY